MLVKKDEKLHKSECVTWRWQSDDADRLCGSRCSFNYIGRVTV